MRIESIRLKNYRAFRDVTVKDIPDFCVIVGANGTGKSTFFDVFNFLQEALRDNVTVALNRRGGFSEVVSRGQEGLIAIELTCRNHDGKEVEYFLRIGFSEWKDYPDIFELLSVKQKGEDEPLMYLQSDRGSAVVREENGSMEEVKIETFTLATPNLLALRNFGYLPEKYPIANEFREFLENWQVSDIQIQNTRERQKNKLSKRLSHTGDNLYQVARYLQENEPERFENIKQRMMGRIPGLKSITVEPTQDGYLLLRFNDGSLEEPFLARYVSDGTLKMFAYLVLLNAPKSVSLLAVEEPENQFYPQILPIMAEEFRGYTRKGGQVFISTHSPDFLNAVKLDEVYWLIKEDGYTTIRRAADDPQLRAFMEDGDMMGHLWSIGLVDGVDPL